MTTERLQHIEIRGVTHISMEQRKASIGRTRGYEKQYSRSPHDFLGRTTNAVAIQEMWFACDRKHGRLKACQHSNFQKHEQSNCHLANIHDSKEIPLNGYPRRNAMLPKCRTFGRRVTQEPSRLRQTADVGWKTQSGNTFSSISESTRALTVVFHRL